MSNVKGDKTCSEKKKKKKSLACKRNQEQCKFTFHPIMENVT